MVVVYESKTGFTKKYADMLGAKMGFKVYRAREFSKLNQAEEIIFLGWLKAGKIQGLKNLRKNNIIAVCASGTARTAEPDPETVIARNKISGIPFFYLRGGCLPLKDLKGMDKILLSMFVKMLKGRADKEEHIEEVIVNIENGFDGVRDENLAPLLEWLNGK